MRPRRCLCLLTGVGIIPVPHGKDSPTPHWGYRGAEKFKTQVPKAEASEFRDLSHGQPQQSGEGSDTNVLQTAA